ncbi:MAG: hypothetical protein KDI30_09785 [Pseudomonadales bacterium]|nr:hypothetical protein [Pseudomonadales bacterium]
MYIPRSFLLLILAAYIFSPTVFSWMLTPGGSWYRPYLIWSGVVLATFILQWRQNNDEL